LTVQDDQAGVYAQIVEGLSSGVVAVDAEGIVSVANAAACQHLNLPEDALTAGKRFSEIPGAAPLLAAFEEVRACHAAVSRLEVVVETGEGPRTLGMNVTPVEDALGREGVVFLFTDLTEVKRLARTAEVNRQLAQIGELTAGVVHELRNPLSVVSGMSELLMRKLEAGTSMHANAKAIFNEAGHMGKLITQFLGFARPYELKSHPCTLGQVFERTVQLCAVLANERSVRLDAQCPQPDTDLIADLDAVVQALGNMLRNAIEVSEPGDCVVFSATTEADCMLFRIVDQGPGIHLAPGEDLFTPFFSKREGGTGLGLAIAQRGIAAHGGTIEYENRDNGGADFVVRIPRVCAQQGNVP
jgi:signal transduction histidine kinase